MTPVVIAPSLEEACAYWSDRPAVTHAGRTLTYGQLWSGIDAITASWLGFGVRPGDRIVCQMPTCPEHLAAIAATWEADAVQVGAHRDTSPTELAEIVRETQAAVLLFQPPPDPRLADPLAGVRAAHGAWPSTKAVVHGAAPHPGDNSLSDILNYPPPFRGRRLPRGIDAPEDTDLLLQTSGTTGRPKMVMESLPALLAKVRFFAEQLVPTPDDIHLLYLPINHVFGLKLALTALLTGGHLVCLERFSPDEALDTIGTEHVTIASGSPTHFTLLLRALDASRHDVNTLRWAVSAAATLPPPLATEMYDRLGCEIFSVYGCSEGFLTVTTDRDDILAGSVGRRVFHGPEGSPPDGRVLVMGPVRGDEARPGEIGEIAYGTTGPVRYWDSSRAGTDGWYRTGDLGRVDAEGRLYVVGRIKEVINRGGLKVSCSEVEAALREHPAVADSAVVASTDEVLGEAICACVVVADGAEAPDLAGVREFLRTRLSRQKLPDELCLLPKLPRSPLGKLDRQALMATVARDDVPRERLSREQASAVVTPGRRRVRSRPVSLP